MGLLLCSLATICGLALSTVAMALGANEALGVWLIVAGWLVAAAAWSRRPALALIALAFTLGALRGLDASQRGPDLWKGTRGAAAHAQVVAFELESAAWPGPSCRVQLKGPPARRVFVRAAAQACRGQPGDGLWLAARGLPARAPKGAVHVATFLRGPLMWAAPAHRSWASAAWSKISARRVRAWSETRGDDALALSAAVALGMRRALPPERRDAMARAGLGHLLAISGLHVASFALIFVALGRRLCAWRGWPMLLIVPPTLAVIAGYVWAMGASASAVRAGVMAAAVLVGVGMGRPGHGRSRLALAATLMLLWQPRWLSSPGFQMSVLAIASLEGVGPRPVLASWRVTWGLAALSAWHFGRVGAVGVLTNLVAIPVFGVCVLAPALVGWVMPEGEFSRLCLALARPGAQLILDVAELGARLPEPGPWGWLVGGLVGLVVHVVAPARDEASAANDVEGKDQPAATWCSQMLRRWAPPTFASLALVLVGLVRLVLGEPG